MTRSARNYGFSMKEAFPAEKSQIRNIYIFISRFFSHSAFGGNAERLLNLFEMATDEIFTNIVKYGFEEPRDDAVVEVTVQFEDNTVSMTFQDNGKPFDPLSSKEQDISLGIEGRLAGGWGIHIVKNSFDEVHYAFENGNNVFTITKRIT